MAFGRIEDFKGLLASNPPFPPPRNEVNKGAVAPNPPIEPPKRPAPPKDSGVKK